MWPVDLSYKGCKTIEKRHTGSIRAVKICKKAGVKQKIKLSGEQTLTMKEELGLSWRLGKKHRRLFNEYYMWGLSKELVSDFVRVEKKHI